MSSAKYKSFIEAIPQEDIAQVINLLTRRLKSKPTTYVPLTYHEQMMNQQKDKTCQYCLYMEEHERGKCPICDEEDESKSG